MLPSGFSEKAIRASSMVRFRPVSFERFVLPVLQIVAHGRLGLGRRFAWLLGTRPGRLGEP